MRVLIITFPKLFSPYLLVNDIVSHLCRTLEFSIDYITLYSDLIFKKIK